MDLFALLHFQFGQPHYDADNCCYRISNSKIGASYAILTPGAFLTLVPLRTENEILLPKEKCHIE